MRNSFRNLIRRIKGQPVLKMAEKCLPDITYVLSSESDGLKEHYNEYVAVKFSDSREEYEYRALRYLYLMES